MIGLILALSAGLIWSSVNVIDKTIVSKYIKSPVFLITIFCVISGIVGLIILLFNSKSINLPALSLLILSAFSYASGVLCYFYAMKIEEPSRVVPLFALTNIFLVILSALFLKEVFNFITYIGIFLIIFGSVLINIRTSILSALTSKALWFMTFGSLGYAVAYVINKHLLSDYSYWQVFGWQRLFIGIFGVLLALYLRRSIKEILLKIRIKYILVSSTAEILNIFGSLLFISASAVWYVALVESVASVQYVFILLWAYILHKTKLSFYSEEINKSIIVQKFISILLIILGIIVITKKFI
ncbi:MAG: EamA family transporter [Patescibacteria group bacterium]|jgi:uncharacterized membrane protein